MNGDSAYSALLGLFGGALVIVLLIALAVVILQIIASVKVYQKAGKAGWEAIVPYYNNWVLCEIAGVKWYFFLGLLATSIFSILGLNILLPLAGLVTLAASFAIHYNIAIKFGKDPIGYGIGLTLLPVVFYCILAFGDAKFKDVKVSSYGPISEEQIEGTKSTTEEAPKKEEKPKEGKFCKNCGAEVSDGKFCPNCGTEIH